MGIVGNADRVACALLSIAIYWILLYTGVLSYIGTYIKMLTIIPILLFIGTLIRFALTQLDCESQCKCLSINYVKNHS